jgi:tetratricopeptide (TPR) repeat protein
MNQNLTKRSGNFTSTITLTTMRRVSWREPWRWTPSRTHALYLLGRLYVQKRDDEKALSFLQRALRLQPDLVEASSLLGTAHMRLGQFANAVPKLEKAAPLDHYGNVHFSCIWRIGSSAKPNARRKRWRARKIFVEALWNVTRP